MGRTDGAGDPLTRQGAVADEAAPRSEKRPMRKRVLVALAGERAPVFALELGRVVANAMHKPLHGLFTSSAPVGPCDVQRILRLPEGALEGVVLDVAVGDPIEQLAALTEAHPTAFVVVGAEPSASSKLGELAERALGSMSVPLLIARDCACGRNLDRILVPLDGTPSTASALAPAGELARQLGASLDIVLVGEAQHLPQAEHGAMAAPQYVDQPHHEWPAFSGEFLHRFMMTIGHCPEDVPTHFYLGAGDPAAEILRYASTLCSNLVVLVWHGCSSEAHGAIFRTVLERASCPVLVLRC